MVLAVICKFLQSTRLKIVILLQHTQLAEIEFSKKCRSQGTMRLSSYIMTRSHVRRRGAGRIVALAVD